MSIGYPYWTKNDKLHYWNGAEWLPVPTSPPKSDTIVSDTLIDIAKKLEGITALLQKISDVQCCVLKNLDDLNSRKN